MKKKLTIGIALGSVVALSLVKRSQEQSRKYSPNSGSRGKSVRQEARV